MNLYARESAVLRDERDPAKSPALARCVGRLEVEALEQLLHHDLRLHLRERGADATTHASAKWDVGIAGRAPFKEAFGPVIDRLAEQLGFLVREDRVGGDARADRQLIAAELNGFITRRTAKLTVGRTRSVSLKAASR